MPMVEPPCLTVWSLHCTSVVRPYHHLWNYVPLQESALRISLILPLEVTEEQKPLVLIPQADWVSVQLHHNGNWKSPHPLCHSLFSLMRVQHQTNGPFVWQVLLSI